MSWDEWWALNKVAFDKAALEKPGSPDPTPGKPEPDHWVRVPVRNLEVSMSVFLFIAAALLTVWARKNGRESPALVRWLSVSVVFATASLAAQLLLVMGGSLNDSFEWATVSGTGLMALSGVALYLAARRF